MHMNRHTTVLAACAVTSLLAEAPAATARSTYHGATPAISLAVAVTRYPGRAP